MPIKFLVAHDVPGIEPESFKAGQVVKDKKPESEMHFVRRGLAAFVDAKGKLTDHEGKEVAQAPATQKVDVAANQADGTDGRAGENPDPNATPRGSSGPGNVVTGGNAAGNGPV